MKKTNNKIDFVILWVDGNDPKWRAEKEKWEQKLGITTSKNIDNSDIRYRDWGLLKYWFRGVEKFAPWVNKIHFITCGHLPEWLNMEHPKLHIVKHSDYMPKDALPTFNSNAIELMIHKIQGLSDNYVLFNDDFFLINHVKPGDFFKNNLPRNSFALHPIMPVEPLGIAGSCFNDVRIINKNFNYRESIRKNLGKYVSISQGKYILKTVPLLGYNRFPGFATFHMPISYKKSTWEKVWAKEGKELKTTIHHRFRDYEKDYSHWLFNYWQFAEGEFKQRSVRFGINTNVSNKEIPKMIKNQKARCINIGDSEIITDFESTRNKILNAFDEILPEKSAYELKEDK